MFRMGPTIKNLCDKLFDFRTYRFTPTYKTFRAPLTYEAMLGWSMLIISSIPKRSRIPAVYCNSFIVMVSLHITAGIDNTHILSRILKRNTIVVLIFFKVDMVVILDFEFTKVF